ncbi:MAG TPA: hypothetical protein VHX68_01490 [Planctomycetaceae bacterium]|nr:hypothetical protein [Planctomycetaceae bacterium]
MSVPTLYFTRIGIDRLDGLEPSGFAIENLEPGINVVYGPNASGKTSLSGAIRQLLAPQERSERFRRAVLRAVLGLDGDTASVDFDMGDVRFQRGSGSQAVPTLVPEGIRDRYIFALHELLQGNASDLAAELLKQSAGGFDLRGARDELGFRAQVSSRRIGEYQNLLDARKRVDEIRVKQESLVEQERRLTELESEYGRTREASDRYKQLEKAAAWLEARRAVDDRAAELAGFPAGMDKLCGDEMERLRELRDRLAGVRGDLQENASVQGAAEERLGETRFGDAPPDEPLIAILRQKCQCLRTLAATLEDRKAKLAAAAKAVEQARNLLGNRVPDSTDPLLDAGRVERLLAFAHQGKRLRSEVDAANQLDGWLAGLDSGRAGADRDELNRAAQILGRWLAADDVAKSLLSASAASRERTIVLGAAIAWGVLAVVLAFTVHLSWLLGLIASGGLAVWALWPSRKESLLDLRPSIESEFARQAVKSPSAWSAETVGSRLGDLQKEASKAAFEQERASRWSDLKPRLLEARQRFEAYQVELAQRLRDAGLAEDLLDTGEEALMLLAKNILACQEAHRHWNEQQAEATHLEQQYGEQLAEIARSVALYSYQTADVEAAAAQVEELDHRRAQWNVAVAELKTCEKERRRLAGEESGALAEMAKFFETARIAPDDEAELFRRLEQLRRFHEAEEALKRARRDVELTARDLGDVTHYEKLGAGGVAAELAECREQANRADELHQQIIAIQTLVQNAKQTSDLEAALAAQEKAAGDLAAQREADCDAYAGDLLCDLLDEEQRELQQPAVLERARHLFGRITHGRYRLDIARAGEGEPAFRAVETARTRVLPLDQLSGGTRLQLLFAVRLAFLEMQEGQWKLPIVLDETLGNSDEARAEQIIDAAIEICRQGRQVFYLTAQHDEVSKWRRRLRNCPDVRWKHVDLAEVRNFSAVERVPIVDYQAPPPVEVVPPDGQDWLGYGKLLGVPMLDGDARPDELHLWYVVDDVQLLYRLLNQDINLWGQLRELVSLGALPADCGEFKAGSTTLRRAEARAGLLETILRYRRVGRGKPVDRAVLEASGAVNERFLPEVTQLAKERAQDARQILAALAEGQVPRFLQRNREKLQQYLAEHEYLDENEPLSVDAVRQRARVESRAAIDGGLIDLFTIDVLINLICKRSTIGPQTVPESTVSPSKETVVAGPHFEIGVASTVDDA